MSKKAKKRPTEAPWDSDDDLLKEDISSVSAFSKSKAEDDDIDEEALLQIEGDEEIGEGDTFEIVDPEASGFDESVDLGLDTSQTEQEALDYEDTVQDEAMEATTDEDLSFSELKTNIKTEPMPVETKTIIHSGLLKDVKKEESDSDEDKGDHRERFKSERKMISLVSSKYSKPIPETLEVTPEMQEEINKFEKDKVPVKQRLGPRTGPGPQNRPQNQRQNQGQFGPRFPGNQNIRGPGPRMGKNQQRQNFQQRNQQERFGPRGMVPEHMNFRPRGPRPMFPHEMNLNQNQAGNQFRPQGPGAPPSQNSLLGPGPPMMQQPRPLMDAPSGQKIHVNPQFFGRMPMPEGFAGQPQPFSQAQPFQSPPHTQPNQFPREAWPPGHPSPTTEGYPPPQPNHQPPFSGPQPPYPPTSAAFTHRPGAPQPLIPTSGVSPWHPQHPPHVAPPQPLLRPPYPGPQGGPPGQPHHFPGPNAQPPRFMPPQSGPNPNQAPPDLHIQFRPMGPQNQRPPNPPNQMGQNQVRQQFPPQGANNIRPQGANNIRPQGRQVMPLRNQIRPQPGMQRARGVLQNAGNRMTGVGRGIAKQAQQQRTNKLVMDARQRLAMRQLPGARNQGFNPTPGALVNKNNTTNVQQGKKITVVDSRGMKRRSLESANVVPVKQMKQEEPVAMEPVDPDLKRALEEQKRQREAIKLKKEQNRLASANQRRKELEEKLAIQGMTIEDLDKQTPQGQGQNVEQQGQKISVLRSQHTSPKVRKTTGQFTNIVQVQTTPVGRGHGTPARPGQSPTARGAADGQNPQQRFNVGQNIGTRSSQPLRLRGRGRGFNKRQHRNLLANVQVDPEQNIISQQNAQQFQQINTPSTQVAEAQHVFKVGQGHQNQNRPNIGQVEGQKVRPVNIVRSDSQGRVIGTYSATPTRNNEGKIVYKVKIQDTSGPKRTVHANTSPPSNRTVIAGPSVLGQGQVTTPLVAIATGRMNDQEQTRTVVATGRTIGLGPNPHLRSRKVSVEGLTSTTQEAKLLQMVKNVGVVCEEIKFIQAQRRAILAFQNIEMAKIFVKKYNRTMVDLTHIHVKEVPE